MNFQKHSNFSLKPSSELLMWMVRKILHYKLVKTNRIYFSFQATVPSVSRSFAMTAWAAWPTPTSTFWTKHLIKLLRARASPWRGTRSSMLSSWATLMRAVWLVICSDLCLLFNNQHHHHKVTAQPGNVLCSNNFLL